MSEEKDKKNLNNNKSEPSKSETSNEDNNQKTPPKNKTTEEKLKEAEDKLLRSLAEIENQRRRFEKEIKDAFEFGSFNFAKENLAILDNLQRAREAIKNDEKLKVLRMSIWQCLINVYCMHLSKCRVDHWAHQVAWRHVKQMVPRF